MEMFVIIIISLAVAILNSFHVLIQWTLNKPGELFTAIPHFFADYFLYVGAIAQGYAGRWIWAEHLFTNEPMAPTWYYWFYVALGHLGSWVKLSPFGTYNVSLIILVFLLCLAWYYLTKMLYPTNKPLQLISWLLILTMTNFFSFARPGLAKLDISKIELLGQFWFSPAPVFARLGGVPYHAVQMILFIVLAIIFSRLIKPKSITRRHEWSHGNVLAWLKFKKRFLGSSLDIGYWVLGIVAALAASANPVQMLLFGVAAILVIGLMPHTAMQRKISTVVMLLLAGGAGAWMTNAEFARQAVFLAARNWEFAQNVPISLPILLQSIGPVLFFIPFGIRNVLMKKNPLVTILVIWSLFSFIFFLSPIPRLLALSPVRFLHPVPYAAALAILGTEGLIELSGLLHRRLKNSITINTIRLILIAVYLLLTIPAISRQFMDRITPTRNPQLLMDTIYNHVPAPIVDALTWLKVTGRHPVNDMPVVLVDPAIPIEVLVPVFTGKISFSGHPIHTLYPDVKEVKRQEFFGGKMSTQDAKQFLSDHRIGYMISKSSSRALAVYWQFVTIVYQNEFIAIYKTGK